MQMPKRVLILYTVYAESRTALGKKKKNKEAQPVDN